MDDMDDGADDCELADEQPATATAAARPTPASQVARRVALIPRSTASPPFTASTLTAARS
jgi:hypothetical protein